MTKKLDMNLFLKNIGELNEAHRASYYRFIYYGITEELLNFQNPCFSYINNNLSLIYLYPNKIHLVGPLNSADFCLKQNLSYTIRVYIKCEYTYLNLDPINFKNTSTLETKLPLHFLLQKYNKNTLLKYIKVKQDLFLCEIPLITDQGTFIINGYERILISQIIRSPGIYCTKTYNNSKLTYIATLISNKGTWTKFILNTDKNNQNKIYIDLTDKSHLKSTILTKLYLFDIFKLFNISFEEIIDNLKYSTYLFYKQKAIKNKNLLTYFSEYIKETNAKWNDYYFLDEDLYEGEPSTNKLIESTNKNIEAFSLMETLVNSKQLNLFSLGPIGRINLNAKLNLNLPKNIDVVTIYDLLRIIDKLLSLKYLNISSDDIDDLQNKCIKSVGELLQDQLRIGFNSLNKRLRNNFTNNNYNLFTLFINPVFLTLILKTFFITNELSQFMDQINPLAEITHKRKVSLLGPNGLKRDQINIKLRDIHPSHYGKFCSIDTPEGQNAGLINSITLFSKINFLNQLETPYFFINKEKINSNKNLIFLTSNQENKYNIAFTDIIQKKNNLLTNTTKISVKNNQNFVLKDLNNIQFTLTSPLQILSLATGLIPFVEHDDTNRALMGSNMQRQAMPLLYTEKPLVGTGLEAIAILDSAVVLKSYFEGTILYTSATKIQIKDFTNNIITYYLKKYTNSNQNTCFNQKPIVWAGEKVYSNQIIADNTTTNDGELAIGRNLLVGYMPWEGYNYEDAIVINEKLLLENVLTSLSIEEYECKIDHLTDTLVANVSNLPYLTSEGIVKLGAFVEENNLLVNKLTKSINTETNEQVDSTLNTSLYVAKGVKGRVIDIRMTYKLFKNTIIYTTIHIYIAQYRKLQIGDKLAGRHGNKGIIARIVAANDMPYLPDGTQLDLLFNPLGVPSRMNVGQLFETLLGLAADKLMCRYKVLPFDEVYGQEASRILINQKLKEAAIFTNLSWLFNSLYPGKIFLRDGRTGEFFDNPITVGKTYILKLIHLVENKLHSRSIGPYTILTEQPLAGKSQQGGQRFGEMEIWALEAYGCSYTLQELLTIKSDDTFSRNLIYNAIISDEELSRSVISESFLTLIRELHALGLDFSVNYITNTFSNTNTIKEQPLDIFNILENRLNLKPLLKLITHLQQNIFL